MLQSDMNCLDEWLQASKMHFEVAECCTLPVFRQYTGEWRPYSSRDNGASEKDLEPLKRSASQQQYCKGAQCGLWMCEGEYSPYVCKSPPWCLTGLPKSPVGLPLNNMISEEAIHRAEGLTPEFALRWVSISFLLLLFTCLFIGVPVVSCSLFYVKQANSKRPVPTEWARQAQQRTLLCSVLASRSGLTV